jgi:hypothetical protein
MEEHKNVSYPLWWMCKRFFVWSSEKAVKQCDKLYRMHMEQKQWAKTQCVCGGRILKTKIKGGLTTREVADQAPVSQMTQHWLSWSKPWTVFTMQIYLKVIYRMLFGDGGEDLSSWWNGNFCFKTMHCHVLHMRWQEALADIGDTPVEHSPYSPDLGPCDISAFPTLNSLRTGTLNI